MDTVLMRKEIDLSVEEAVEILKSADYNTIAVPPSFPKGGDIYLFKPEKKANTGKLMLQGN